jgi:hypothetical protein
MKIKRKKTDRQLQRRQWTKKQLTEADFNFAVSSSNATWNSLSHRLWQCEQVAAKKVIAEMLDWELFRELDDPRCVECKREPYLAVQSHQQKVDEVLKPAPRPPPVEALSEVPLSEVQSREAALQQNYHGRQIHAFEIDLFEESEITVKRFHKWLARKWDRDYRKTPWRRRMTWELKQQFARRGRLRYGEYLRALAVHRLKKAGYTRQEAEKKLGLKIYALNPLLQMNVKTHGTNYWNKLPKLAEREIEKFRAAILPLYTS